MPHKLFIRPELTNRDAIMVFHWGLYEATGQQLKTGGPCDLDMVSQTLMQNGIDEVEVIGLWPGNAAYSGFITVPGNQARYLQQALPFAVEDQLAQDIDSVHIAVGTKQSDGQYPVHVITLDVFERFFDALIDFVGEQYSLKAVHIDLDLLPLDDHALVAWVDALQFMARNQHHPSAVSRRENLIPYLDAMYLGTEEERDEDAHFRIKLFSPKSHEEELGLLTAEIQQYPGVELECEAVELDHFELLCTSYFHLPQAPINLCQGSFRVANQNTGWFHQWRYVAMIAGVAFLLQLGVFVGKGWQMQQEAEAIGQTALTEYKRVVPNATRLSIDKLPRIIKGKLNQARQQGGASTDFMTLLGEAGYQFSRASDKQQLAFKSINYNAQKGELVMEMQAKSFEQLDQLKQAIVDAGLSAKISSAVQEDQFFRGRISVSGS